MLTFRCCCSWYRGESGKCSSVALTNKSRFHSGRVEMQSPNVAHIVVGIVSCKVSVGMSGSEHRMSVLLSGSTVTGTASGGGRESWKVAAPLVDTVMHRRENSTFAEWYFQEIPGGAVACWVTL